MNGRTIMGTACAAAVVSALAYGSPEYGRRMRAEANAKMAAVAADACGRRVTARIDWAALDTLDYHDENKDDSSRDQRRRVSSGVTRACRSLQGALRSSCFAVPFASTVVIDARTSFPFWIAMCV